MAKRYGVIVDGYSTGAGLAKEFEKYGIPCLHVQSQISIPSVYKHTFNPKDYEDLYIFDGSLAPLVKVLAQYPLAFVVVGAECGIALADELSEVLNLPTNGTQLSACRRDKYLMAEQVAKHGIQTIPSFCSQNIEDIFDWVNKQQHRPFIVKPLNSAGGEGVKICYSLEDISNAYFAIMNAKYNMLGFENKGVIIQHYITGKEYVINTVSYAGQHKLCEIWQYTRYHRKEGRQIYDTAEIVDYEPVIHEDIIKYSMEVLNALGIQYGPAHVELLVNDNGCFLVELGARLMGANLPFDLLAKCISTPQALMTVLAYANPQQFVEKIKLPYEILQPLTAVFMVSDIQGVVKKINHQSEIKKCPSFFDMKLKVEQQVSETIDYQTSPGMIYLSHPSRETINQDKEYIRNLEKNMFDIELI